jgi:integrase
VAKTAFSDVGLRSLPVPEKGQVAYWDEKLPSFGCRVSQAGSKTFVLKRNNSLITIGRYGVLSLADARSEAKRLLAEFTLGKTRPQAVAYSAAVDLFVEDKKRNKKASTATEYGRVLKKLGFTGQVSAITSSDASLQLRKIKDRSAYDHALVYARIFFNWCIKRRYMTDNPTSGLSTHAKVKGTRVLSDAELQLIWQACNEPLPDAPEQSGENLPGHFRSIVRLLMVTGQRRGEIAGLRGIFYSHNQQTITLPPELTKNSREHQFPIGSLARSLLPTDLPKGVIFPTPGTDEKPFSAWSKNKILLDEMSGVTGWKLHDLRRTFRTNLGRLKVAPHIAERLLNHVTAQTDMEEVYDHHPYIDEMRVAVNLWEAHLREHIIHA